MSDINWRDIREDTSVFEQANANRAVIILTEESNKTPRDTTGNYIDYYTYVDRVSGERVKYYAFL